MMPEFRHRSPGFSLPPGAPQVRNEVSCARLEHALPSSDLEAIGFELPKRREAHRVKIGVVVVVNEDLRCPRVGFTGFGKGDKAGEIALPTA